MLTREFTVNVCQIRVYISSAKSGLTECSKPQINMVAVALLLLSAISLANAQLEPEPLSTGFQLQALEKLVRIEMMLDNHRQEFEILKTGVEECAAAQSHISSTAGKPSVCIILFIFLYIVKENGHALQY